MQSESIVKIGSFNLSKERPTLGDHPKAHKTLYEKHCAFCEKCCAFCEKKHWKATKIADSTQSSHLDLMFHRVQREGQLCIFYVLVMFGGAHVCLLVHVVHVCICGACMAMYVFGGPCVVCVCICIYADICFWWCICVYMMDIYICTFNWWCTCVHMCMFVYLCTHFLWCMYVYMVHPCTNVCLVVHVCVYDTHAPLIGDACSTHVCMWCMYVYVVHLCMHICVWGAWM